MNREEVIQSLIDLGMNRGEAKTYTTLCLHGASEATPLAKRAGLPQPKIYENLRSLMNKDFVVEFETGTRAKKYEAVSYSIVFDKLESQLRTQLNKSRVFFENNISKPEKDGGSLMSVRIGMEATMTGIANFLMKAEKNVIMVENSYYHKIFNKLGEKIDIPVYKISPNSTPSWMEAIKLKVLQSVKKKLMADISSIQPAFIAIDVDKESKTSRGTSIITPPSDDEDPFIVIFSHPTIVNYQTKVLLNVMEIMNEKNLLG